MTCTRITAHLLNGISYVPGEMVSLDGPLLYAVTLERMGEEFHRSQPTKEELAQQTTEPDPAMPLSVHRAGGTWVYTVSAGEMVEHHGRTLTHWNKRVDDGLLVAMVQDGIVDMGRSSKVQINSGQYKSYHMPIYDELVERVVWWALTPDPPELARLLREHVHHIGKGRNSGHGVVTRWEVEEVASMRTDRWMWAAPEPPAGPIPARPIPVRMLPEWDDPTEIVPVRPPYWLIQHQEECAMMAPGGMV